jgi:hypothetical protein
MTFAAPIAEQLFVLKHITGIDAKSPQHERFRRCDPRRGRRRLSAASANLRHNPNSTRCNRIGDTVGARLIDGEGRHARRLSSPPTKPMSPMAGDRSTHQSELWRTGPALQPGDRRARLPGRCQHGLCPVPRMLTVGAIEAHGNHHGSASQQKAAYPAQARHRRSGPAP